MEYDLAAVLRASLRFSRGSYVRRAWQSGLALAILLLFSFTAAIHPLVSEIDPWHGHVVVGSADRALALLDHRHSHLASRNQQSTGDGNFVLSLVEREMLSSLSDLSNYSAIVPSHIIPLLIPILLLPLGFVSLPRVATIGLKPPNPPPRSFS